MIRFDRKDESAGRVCCRCGAEFTSDRRPVAIVDLDAHRRPRPRRARTGRICSYCAGGSDR